MTTYRPNSWRNAETPTSVTDEVKIIPRWAIALAVMAFVSMQYLYWVIWPAHRHHPTAVPFGVRFYFAFSGSVLMALYVLMVGYVSRDAPRRNMGTVFWTLVCLIPGGIGSVLYFLLRLPIVSLCPSCGTRIQSEFHFCPQCAFQVSAACGKCYRGVRITDLFCVNCGHDLATDNTPSRLRAFHS
jgi:hypothetical protein